MHKKFKTYFNSILAGLYLLLSPFLSASACPCHEIKSPEQHIQFNRQEGIRFSHSKQYDKEFSQAIDGAYAACKKHLGKKNIAIVSDIDETLLDNREELAKRGEFKYIQFVEWINQANAPTLKPTAQFLKWAKENGFTIFLVTGRHESERLPTIKNLAKRKIEYDGLYMRPSTNDESAEKLKTAIRESLEKLGYKIIVNIGDQYSDLAGGYALDCEKLPNRIYYIP